MIKYQPQVLTNLYKRGHVPGPAPCQPKQDLIQDPVSKVCWYSSIGPRGRSLPIVGTREEGLREVGSRQAERTCVGVPETTLSFTDSVGEPTGLVCSPAHGYDLSQLKDTKLKSAQRKSTWDEVHQNKTQASKVPLPGESQKTHWIPQQQAVTTKVWNCCLQGKLVRDTT